MMIRVFCGADTRRVHQALEQALNDAKATYPNAVLTRFDDLNFNCAAAREALAGQSMFDTKNIVVLDRVTEHPDGKNAIELLLEYRDSPNIVFCREQHIENTLLEKLNKCATVHTFSLVAPKQKGVEQFNSFAIARAFARRDKKGSWVELEKARRRGISAEEVHGILFWQTKTLYIAATQTKQEAILSGVKEYTWEEAVRHKKNFLTSDLERLLTSLKDIYHRSHRGELDLWIAIEKLLLSI